MTSTGAAGGGGGGVAITARGGGGGGAATTQPPRNSATPIDSRPFLMRSYPLSVNGVLEVATGASTHSRRGEPAICFVIGAVEDRAGLGDRRRAGWRRGPRARSRRQAPSPATTRWRDSHGPPPALIP